MKKLLLLIVLCFTFPVFSQHWEWVKQPANTGSGDLHLAIGTNGVTYLSASSYNLSNQYDAHLIKQLNGNPIWDKNFGKNMQIKGLATNSAGDVFLSGNFKDTILVNGTQLISAGLTDAFLFKLDSVGQTLWLKTFSSPDEDICNDVYLDYSGNILVTGALGNTAIVEGTTYPTKGLFIARFNSAGSLLNIIRSTHGGQGVQVKSDSLNNIYLLGNSPMDTLLLDTVVVYPPYYNGGNYFVTKFNAAGNYKGFVGVGSGFTFDVDPSGTFYVLENSYYSGSTIRQFSSALIMNWKKYYTGGNAVCLNSKQELCVTGSTFNADSTFSYFWKYDKNGNLLDEAFSKLHQQIDGRWMKTDSNDNIYLLGNCSQSTDFGNIHINMNAGQSFFMAKIKGKKPFSSFTYMQAYEVQTVYFKSRCLNDTALRWIFPGGVPAISSELNPTVSYATPGNKMAILIAYNGFSSDTTIQQINLRPEPQDTLFMKTIDQASWGCCDVQLYNTTSDGGFVVSYPGIYKFNRNGNLEWKSTNVFSSSYVESIAEINGGYITLSNGSNFPWLKKINAGGKILWTKGYSGSPSAWGLCASYEGGYLTGGASVIKNDSVGNILWQYIYPFYPTNVLQHTNGTYIIQGNKYMNGVNNSFVAQINGNGTLNWIKGYSNTNIGSLHTSIVCRNKDIVITGNTGAWGSQESYILRLDSMGNLKWAKTYKAGEFWIMGVADVGNGKLMMRCNYGGLSNTRQIVVLLIDQNGDQVWNRATDINDMSMSHGIVSHGDGHAFFFGMKNQDNFVVRTNLLPPPCLSDSININVTTRLTSSLTSTMQVDTSHYVAVNSSIPNSQTMMPLIPHIVCTTSGGLITDVAASEIITSDAISIFPNPSSGLFTINKLTTSKSSICVYDVLGNCVLTKTELTTNHELDMSKHAKGIYFVEISSGNEKLVKKISLQ